jgi:hypothetical protein
MIDYTQGGQFQFRVGKVISVDDPEKTGRAQIQVYPELASIPDADCPWAFPLFGGLNDNSHYLPPVGSIVPVYFELPYMRETFFLPTVIGNPKQDRFQLWVDTYKDKIQDMTEAPEAATFVSETYADGVTRFDDTANGQHGIYHPASEAYVMFDKDGKLIIELSKQPLTIQNKDKDMTMTFDPASGDIATVTKGNVSTEAKKDQSLKYEGNWVVEVKGDTTIKTTGKTNIESTGDLSIVSKGKANLESTGDLTVTSKASATINANAGATVKSSAKVVIDAPILDCSKVKMSQGSIPPKGAGVLMGLPMCCCSGAPLTA